MDSLTHIVLGAATGEAVLGKKAGKRAMFWGAALATAPDLDVLLGIFLSDLDKIIFHRGITHSFFFIALMSPVYGKLISLIDRKSEVGWKSWSLLAFINMMVHALLDSFTSYGTQIFLPFSNNAVAIGSISVIDPLFTIPLIVVCVWLLIKPVSSPNRVRNTLIALGLSLAYLTATYINQQHMIQQFNKTLSEQSFTAEDMDTKPTLINNLLWRSIARDGDQYIILYNSLIDGTPPRVTDRVQGDHHLIEPYLGKQSIQRLIWVSEGFYQVEETETGYLFNDLRFGRVAEFSGDDTPYAFSYRVDYPADPEEDFIVSRVELQFDRDRERGSFRELWKNIRGK